MHLQQIPSRILFNEISRLSKLQNNEASAQQHFCHQTEIAKN
jgi:hypothetical protein